MNRKRHEVEVPEAKKAGQQGGEAAVAEIDQDAAVSVALAEFGAACEAVTAKRRRVYERYRELDEKMKGPGLDRITMPEADPFDLDALKKAAMETGSPQEAKEWIAAVRAIAGSAYRDNFAIHEHHRVGLCDFMRRLCKYDYQPVNGKFELPDLPGMGNELSDYALENCEKVVLE